MATAKPQRTLRGTLSLPPSSVTRPEHNRREVLNDKPVAMELGA